MRKTYRLRLNHTQTNFFSKVSLQPSTSSSAAGKTGRLKAFLVCGDDNVTVKTCRTRSGWDIPNRGADVKPTNLPGPQKESAWVSSAKWRSKNCGLGWGFLFWPVAIFSSRASLKTRRSQVPITGNLKFVLQRDKNLKARNSKKVFSELFSLFLFFFFVKLVYQG